jgi:hypothetical protein
LDFVLRFLLPTRAATPVPSFPETTSQMSSTELQHRHHLFLRRPASCLSLSCDIATIFSRGDQPAAFHRAATLPSPFPDDRNPSPGCCLRLEFGQLLLFFFFNNLLLL